VRARRHAVGPAGRSTGERHRQWRLARYGRTKIRFCSPLTAKRMQGHELPSAQKDRPLPQTAVPADPVANRRGIGGDHLASRFGSEIFSTVVVDQPRRMKTQDRPSSDADPIMRDRAQDKRAGRITGTVDDDAIGRQPPARWPRWFAFKTTSTAIPRRVILARAITPSTNRQRSSPNPRHVDSSIPRPFAARRRCARRLLCA
jgi:hypothetical protein